MTREEAIEVIEQDIPCEHDRDLIEALEMAISALKEPTWQEKLEKEYLFESIKEDMTKLQVENERLFKEVEALKGEWIPVSERLPEDHKDVLICLSSDQICIGCYNSHKLPFSNNAIGWGASYTHNWCSNDVDAWQPLPEPYKAESEDNK